MSKDRSVTLVILHCFLSLQILLDLLLIVLDSVVYEALVYLDLALLFNPCKFLLPPIDQLSNRRQIVSISQSSEVISVLR